MPSSAPDGTADPTGTGALSMHARAQVEPR